MGNNIISEPKGNLASVSPWTTHQICSVLFKMLNSWIMSLGKITQNGNRVYKTWEMPKDLLRAGSVRVCQKQRHTTWQCMVAVFHRQSDRHSVRQCCCCWKSSCLHRRWWCQPLPDQWLNQQNDQSSGKIKNTCTATHIITTTKHSLLGNLCIHHDYWGWNQWPPNFSHQCFKTKIAHGRQKC